ncbi:hypothetical protein [Novosphingobium sp.]|uniref:hypothetical protein n=1 Tax=Novosphingobium sp. TaxID=1874826 RepID=UPI0035B1D247
MTRRISRGASVLASVAALAMMASPAMARDRGWGGGWGGGWGRHHHDRVDAGDVLAGILIIGGIAAIASAASNNKQKRAEPEYRYPDAPARPDSRGYAGNDDRPQWNEGTGINGAVNRCIDEVSRGKTGVDTVDNVTREGDGWRVQGRVTSGDNFTCAVDGDGRIRQVSIAGRAI